MDKDEYYSYQEDLKFFVNEFRARSTETILDKLKITDSKVREILTKWIYVRESQMFLYGKEYGRKQFKEALWKLISPEEETNG